MANKATTTDTPTEVTTEVTTEETAAPITVTPHRMPWVLLSIAGVGLIVLGLLGGILIGQNLGRPGEVRGQSTSHVFVQHPGQGQRETIRERLKDRWQNEQQRRAYCDD